LVTQWLGAAGTPQPGSWRDSWNSYALSLRTVVWMQELARRRSRLPQDLVQRMEVSCAQQLRFLERNLETDLGGNHLVKNIKALIWGSAYFAGAEAAHWRAIGLELLRQELPRQILADGMHEERSASYHAQVFADLMECRHALGLDPLGGRLDATLARMAQVTADMAHPDGGPALFNDAGLSMAYAPGDCIDVYERLFGTRPRARPVFGLETAGYFGLHAPQSTLIIDCGRIGPDDLPAHAHGDVLSFEWSVGDDRLVVDQGVFEYVAGERRQQARATASHNTLALDGVDQADFFGAFRCGRRPSVEVLRWSPESRSLKLEGSHDGYAHLPGQPRHRRTFEASPTQLVIRDRLEGTTDRLVHARFLLHPDVTVELERDEVMLRRARHEIVVTSNGVIRVEPAVWWPDMGLELGTRRIVIELARGMIELVTTLRLVTGDAHA
jgi:uncharacterized heparinase superfamily protein